MVLISSGPFLRCDFESPLPIREATCYVGAMTTATEHPALACRPTATAAGWGFALLLVLALDLASACNVPVFRYALERWPPDAYEITVFHREPLTTNQAALVEALEKTAFDLLANITVERVNLAGRMSEPMQTLWKAQTNAPLPWMVARYPGSLEASEPVWAGPLATETVRTLVDSPARRELVRRLTKGDAAVWLLLEHGGRARNDAVARLLETESRSLEKSLKLPEPAPDDPPARTELPLKIAFSTVRVSRADAAERMLVNMLLHVDSDFAARTEPMVFAVIGRGRAMPPLTGRQLSAEILGQVADFLVSACSCEVKSMNPGFDLLLAADWDALIEGRAVKDPELPPLIGMSQFAPAATNGPLDAPALAVAGVAPEERGSLVRNTLVALGALVLLLLTATVILKTRVAKRAERP